MGIADEMNNEATNTINKEDFKEYVYVMVSTLNQMVNYIPLKYFKFKEVFNITVKVPRDKDGKKVIKYFDNDKWDENLKAVYKNKTIVDIKMDEKNFYSLTLVKNKLEDEIENKALKNKKIFWNITGGQRHIIMAINQVAKNGDVICYLEGNNNQMMIYDVATNSTNPIDYGLNLNNELTIDIALKLMGMQFNSSNSEIGKDDERNFYIKFLDEYLKKKDLRENLIILNKDYPKPRAKKNNESDEEYQNKKQKFDKLREESKKKIKTILASLNQETLDKKLNRNQAFGYILEELTFYKLEEVLKKQIEDKKIILVHSLKVKNEEINKQTIAEFDIALLTDTGKFIMFECKSGVMDGNIAKARKYATYAVSGVYGVPILVNPLVSTEITENENAKLESNLTQGLDIDIYKYIKEATSSAKRANLEVWGLDEIGGTDKVENKLKKYIEL